MLLRPPPRLSASLAIFACLLPSGCSVDTRPKQRVTLTSSLSPGPEGKNCDRSESPYVTVGSFGDSSTSEPSSIEAGGVQGDWTVTVTCSVKPKGNGFDVRAEMQAVAHLGAEFRIQGFFVPNDQPQPGVTVALTGGNDRYVGGSSCVARYASDRHTVAPGTVWAEVTCPTATSATKNKRFEGKPIICDLMATFRFEECLQ